MAEVEVFTWSPRIGTAGDFTQATLSSQFGDGYRQVAEDGLNSERQEWPLTFKGREAYVVPIRDFLRRHKGARPFQWTPPLGEPGLYLAEGYGLTAHGGDLYSVTVTFKQFFGA
ncbi:Phage minor tail protein [compost metagenome]